MLIKPGELESVFKRVKKQATENATPVQLFVSLSCDSVCAVRIFLALLQMDMIPFELHPVQGFDDIMRINKETLIPRHDEIHSIFFVGCGGNYDMTELLFGDGECPDNISVYICDAQRPFNLENVHEQGHIFLLDEEFGKEIQSYPRPVDDSDSEGESDSIDISDDSDFDGDERPRKRRKISDEDNEAKQERRMARLKVDEYYKLTFWAKSPASFVFWKMASDLKKSDNNLLWLAILGLTDLFISDKLSRKDYDNSLQSYVDAVLRHNNPIQKKKSSDAMDDRTRRLLSSSTPYRIDLNQSSVMGGGADNSSVMGNQSMMGGDMSVMSGAMNNTSVMNQSSVMNQTGSVFGDSSSVISHATFGSDDMVKSRKKGHVQATKEFHFTLMRHWNLLDSMYHSKYVATKLSVWTKDGLEDLKTILVQMGIQLDEARQPFQNMALDLKQDLTERIHKGAVEMGLGEDLMYSSFTRQHGDQEEFSASDMVLAVDALLTASKGRCKETDENPKAYALAMVKLWDKNFSEALSSLSISNYSLLEKGIRLAIDRQKDIVEMGRRLIEKNQIHHCAQYRYAYIDQKNKFTNAVVLTRLALFIMDAIQNREASRSSRKRRKLSHFVLCSLCDVRNSYVIVGIPANKRNGPNRKGNVFGTAFQEARDAVNARAKHSGFESSVIEVQKDDVKKFNDALQMRLQELTMI